MHLKIGDENLAIAIFWWKLQSNADFPSLQLCTLDILDNFASLLISSTIQQNSQTPNWDW